MPWPISRFPKTVLVFASAADQPPQILQEYIESGKPWAYIGLHAILMGDTRTNSIVPRKQSARKTLSQRDALQLIGAVQSNKPTINILLDAEITCQTSADWELTARATMELFHPSALLCLVDDATEQLNPQNSQFMSAFEEPRNARGAELAACQRLNKSTNVQSYYARASSLPALDKILTHIDSR